MIRVVGAVAVVDGRVLLARRGPGSYEGRWEFPGGKVEAGEDDRAALAREIREELAVSVRVSEHLATGSDERIELHCYRVQLDGEPRALEHTELAWFPLSALASVDVPPADVPAVEALLAGV
ncbi:MAG TPA: (deoxy)nucleoside triphosphate pyrophosphohydrolase [Myxococcota bacterium]|nr:(deoxy)nucleoside triphosphate pyrophosphohydrolase [Myxococcota bacterium]